MRERGHRIALHTNTKSIAPSRRNLVRATVGACCGFFRSPAPYRRSFSPLGAAFAQRAFGDCIVAISSPRHWEDRMFTRVCKEETLAEGGMRIVIVDAQLVMLAWADNGAIKAFQGVCPHTNAPLADAEFDGTTLTCPLHLWTWDMNTGLPTHEHATPLAEYPVKIEEGVVYIDAEGVSPILAGA
jgi:toluene monooxygenase system ferredoxin subunit